MKALTKVGIGLAVVTGAMLLLSEKPKQGVEKGAGPAPENPPEPRPPEPTPVPEPRPVPRRVGPFPDLAIGTLVNVKGRKSGLFGHSFRIVDKTSPDARAAGGRIVFGDPDLWTYHGDMVPAFPNALRISFDESEITELA